MTITTIQTDDAADGQSYVTVAFGDDVVVGSLITVWCFLGNEDGAEGAFVAGDCTKDSGTATIDGFVLDGQLGPNNMGEYYAQIGIWSTIVTGSGSLSVNVTNSGGTGNGICIHVHESGGNWDENRLEDSELFQLATNDVATAYTDDCSSAGDALFLSQIALISLTAPTIVQDSPWLEANVRELSNGAVIASEGDYILASGATTDAAGYTLSGGTQRWGFHVCTSVWKEAGDTNVLANTDALVLAEQQATISLNVDVSAAVDALALTEYQATIDLDAGTEVEATTAALVLAEQQATITYDVNVLANVDALVLTEYSAQITEDTEIDATTVALVLAEQQATIVYDRNVLATADVLTLAEQQATITFDVNVEAAVDVLAIAELQATVSLDVDISANVDALALTEQPATITYDVEVLAGVDALTLTGLQATVGTDVEVLASVHDLTLAEQAALVSLNVSVQAGVDALSLAEYQAAIATSPIPVITDVDGDETWNDTDTGLVATGSNFV